MVEPDRSAPSHEGGDCAALIEVKGLNKIFGKTPLQALEWIRQGRSKEEILAQTGHTVGLHDINLRIERGEIFVIMGLSGSGKSTLIRHFNRLIDPTSGEVIVDGVDVMGLPQPKLEQFRRTSMAMVFQRFALLPHRTVLDNVAYGLAIQGVPTAQRNQRAREWLSRVGLDGYESQYPAQLSGGQQQRVGLARALATDAEILLMDEAFSALDPLIRSEMQDQLLRLQTELHKTIVFITHDLDEALRLGNHIAILRDGRLVQVGRPEEILLSPADDYVEAFVRDVNRSRVLSVETVMRPPAARITAATLDEALKKMKALPEAFAHWVAPDGYKGILAALEDGGSVLRSDLPTFSPGDSIEQALPETLNNAAPLAVVDANGQLQGEITRAGLAAALSSTPTTDRTTASSD